MSEATTLAKPAASPVLSAKRLVIKIGSALLVDQDSGKPHQVWLDALCDDIASAHARGQEVVVVTSGATFAGALKVCAAAPKGSTVLCMLPDTGERYLSTPLFADVPADMTEEEVAISYSTPGSWLKPPA